MRDEEILPEDRVCFYYDFRDINPELILRRSEESQKKILHNILSKMIEPASGIRRDKYFRVFSTNIEDFNNEILFLGNGDLIIDAMSYVFSPERSISPSRVICEDGYYSFVEEILKSERGSGSYLSSGFLGLGYVLNERKIYYCDKK
jgi:hypothetical protein